MFPWLGKKEVQVALLLPYKPPFLKEPAMTYYRGLRSG